MYGLRIIVYSVVLVSNLALSANFCVHSAIIVCSQCIDPTQSSKLNDKVVILTKMMNKVSRSIVYNYVWTSDNSV
jgi:hypothetical protein